MNFLRQVRFIYGEGKYLYHLLNQLVDLISLVTVGATLVVVVELLTDESLARGVHLEGPQEVGGLLEVLARGEDLVDHVLNAHDVGVTKSGLDNGVGAEGDSLAANLAEASLVDQLSNRLHVGSAVSDVGLNHTKHLDGGSVQAHEDCVIYLTQTEQLKDLLDLGGHTDDTADTDHEGDLVLRGNVDLVVGLGSTTVGNGISLDLKTQQTK